MRVITILQPYASLIAFGAKRYETRSWRTWHRGPIAIHAGKKPFEKVLAEYAVPPDTIQRMQEDCVHSLGIDFDFAYGAIIAVGYLVRCYEIIRENARITLYRKGMEPVWYHPTDKELLYGDWTPGRYAWELANVRTLPVPVPYRGQQGLWSVPDAIVPTGRKE
jgi:hypothetical protein